MRTTVPNNIFTFLKKLEKNNNRQWFNDHKLEFKSIENELKLFNSALLSLLNKHDDVDKMQMFRIYRDVRFSKNKLPYKTHFGCAFHRTKPKLRGGYYVHLCPNNQSFLGVGFWDPNKDDLFRIRKEFEIEDAEFRQIINNPELKNVWGVLKGDEVKTAPKGFDKDHKAIDLIRKKQFVFTKQLSDENVLSNDFIEKIDQSFKAIRPYFDYMSEVLTTNLNGESII